MLASTANHLIRELLGPVCVSCRNTLERPLAGPACEACWQAVPLLEPPWCEQCGDGLPAASPTGLCARCRMARRGFDAARSAARYEGSLRALIRALKYQRRRELAAPLAAMMGAAAGNLLADADAVIPVPLHPWRALVRGFNQADDLARHLGLPIWRVLCRRRLGRPQASVPAEARHDNVWHAFALRRPRNDIDLHDRTVVLVDDVMTTGATVHACSVVLRRAGVRSVRALTVARAVAAPPRQSPLPPLPSAARRR